MRWKVEDTPERVDFRAEFVEWLGEVLPAGWIEALAGGTTRASPRPARTGTS